MILGFDIDEVICFTVDKTITYLKDKWDIQLNREEINIYEFSKHPLLEGNDIVLEDLYCQYRHPSLSFYEDCLPDKKGVDVIKKLKRAGHLIYFISSRPVGSEDKTALWLRKHKIPFNYIKHVGVSDAKGRVCKQLKLDFYMDDYGKCLDSLLEQKKFWHRGIAVLDKPWNRDYNNEKVMRIKKWHDVLRKLGC